MPNPAPHIHARIGEDGKVIPPRRGRPPGSRNKVTALARENIDAVFERLGGVEGMVNWAKASPKNLYAFYAYIYLRMLGAQGGQRRADPMANEIDHANNDNEGDLDSASITASRSKV